MYAQIALREPMRRRGRASALHAARGAIPTAQPHHVPLALRAKLHRCPARPQFRRAQSAPSGHLQQQGRLPALPATARRLFKMTAVVGVVVAAAVAVAVQSQRRGRGQEQCAYR